MGTRLSSWRYISQSYGASCLSGPPLEFLTQIFPHRVSSNPLITVQVFLPGDWFLKQCPFLNLLPQLLGFAFLSLQSWGPQFAQCPPLLWIIETLMVFFCLFNLLLSLGQSFQLPISFYVELESRSLTRYIFSPIKT